MVIEEMKIIELEEHCNLRDPKHCRLEDPVILYTKAGRKEKWLVTERAIAAVAMNGDAGGKSDI